MGALAPCKACKRPTDPDTLEFNLGLCDPCAYDVVVAPTWHAGIARIARRAPKEAPDAVG